VQRKFKYEYGRPPPDVKSIKAWYSKFVETGSVGDLNRRGRPSVSDETVDTVVRPFNAILVNRRVVPQTSFVYLKVQ
jgi:hypothetical protein